MASRTKQYATATAGILFRGLLAVAFCLPGGVCLCRSAAAATTTLSAPSSATCCASHEEAPRGEGFTSHTPAKAGCCGASGGCFMETSVGGDHGTRTTVPHSEASATALVTTADRSVESILAPDFFSPSPPGVCLSAAGHIQLGVIVR